MFLNVVEHKEKGVVRELQIKFVRKCTVNQLKTIEML